MHYEGELVVVIGRTAKDVSIEDAPGYIFGVTAGNQVVVASFRICGCLPGLLVVSAFTSCCNP